MSMPLEGIRVLDMTAFQQGPAAGTYLADLGADVIKLEDPRGGDGGRGVMSVLGALMGSATSGANYYFAAHNRNKRGIAVDVKKEPGRQVIFRLIPHCDVFLSNFLPQTLAGLGLGYAALSEINPRLVYALGSGYGPKGPDRDKPSYDLAAQARSGMMSIVAEPEHPPLDGGIGIADQSGGLMLAYGVLAALLARERTGRGQEITASLLGTAISLQAQWPQAFFFTGQLPAKVPRTEARNPFWNTYQAGDGKWFVLSMTRSDEYWPRLCRVLQRPELAHDPRFATHEQRLANGRALVAIFDQELRARPRDEWLRLMAEAGVICDPVNTYADVVRDPQVLANEYVVEFDHPVAGRTKAIGIPVHFSDTHARMRMPAPELGQHTEEVLLELGGYDWNDIVALKEAGVII